MELIRSYSEEQRRIDLARMPMSSRAKNPMGPLTLSLGFLYSIFPFRLLRDKPPGQQGAQRRQSKSAILGKTGDWLPNKYRHFYLLEKQSLHKSCTLKLIKIHQGHSL